MVIMSNVGFGQTWSKEGSIDSEEMTEKKKNQIINIHKVTNNVIQQNVYGTLQQT